MTLRTLGRLLGAYFAVLAVACALVAHHYRLVPTRTERVIVSAWRGGERVGRWFPPADVVPPFPSEELGEEVIVASAPLLGWRGAFPFAIVPGRDGVLAELDGRVAVVTVDDLLVRQAYDRDLPLFDPSIAVGVVPALVIQILAQDLKTTPDEIEHRARLERVRIERRSRTPLPPRPAPGEPLRADVERAVRAASHHLAMNLDRDGRFRYLFDAPSNRTIEDYNWPRHAGATFFLAQAATALNDPEVRYASLRAAAQMRDLRMTKCGERMCIDTGSAVVDIGSSALALIAFTEMVRSRIDLAYRPWVERLAAFLRSQQRPDGEFMHFYDRAARAPVDQQVLYYTGEATLALARTYRITGDPADLDAARRGLAYLTGPGWSFFGSRYYFNEEHWTCQALAELWDVAPDRTSLDFCVRWHEYQRRIQQSADDSPFDADGSFGLGPIVAPRLTPASSRGEAAAATLDVLRRSAAATDQTAPLEDELSRAISFVLRHQLHAQPRYLFTNPNLVDGAIPGSPVDWRLRIDYAQHAGSMMVRWLALHPPPT